MMLVFFFFFFFLLLLPLFYLSLLWSNTRFKKASEELEDTPGPVKLPIIGNLHQLAGGDQNLHRRLWELSKRHGPLMYLKLGQVSAFVVSSADLAKEVLKKHDVDCHNRPPSSPRLTLSYGYSDIAFASYGERWKERRRICVEEFMSSKKVAAVRSVVEEEVMKSIASRTGDSPVVVDVSDFSCFLINSIICKMARGKSHHDDGREYIRFRGIIEKSEAILSSFFLGDYFPRLGWVDVLTGMRGRLRRIFFELDSFFDQLIKERGGLNHDGGSILDALLEAQGDTRNLTEQEVKGLLMNVFLAGTSTSSSIMEWAMTELMRHPEAMRRSQDEVRGCVGRKGKVEEGDLRQIRYLKAVIKETMRLHPPTPLLIPRESVHGFDLHGHHVAPKTTIIVNAFAIGRDPASWERPDEFIPERFMDETNDDNIGLRSNHDFRLLPFGEGRRACPGMNLGLLMTELGLANLLHCFDWSLPVGMTAGDIDMREAPGITVHRATGLRLMATKHIHAGTGEWEHHDEVGKRSC